MKRFHLFAACVAVLVGSPMFVQQAFAQSGPVAIVDLKYIFERHQRFLDMQAAFKRDAEAAEAAVKREQANLEAKAQSLQQFKRGTPEYKSLMEEITNRQADMAAKMRLQKTEFIDREAKMWLSAYQEVSDAIKAYAERNGISVVFRFDGDEIDPANPRDVQVKINKNIVYYHPTIDITPIILQSLQGRPAGATATRPAQPGAPGYVPPRR